MATDDCGDEADRKSTLELARSLAVDMLAHQRLSRVCVFSFAGDVFGRKVGVIAGEAVGPNLFALVDGILPVTFRRFRFNSAFCAGPRSASVR